MEAPWLNLFKLSYSEQVRQVFLGVGNRPLYIPGQVEEIFNLVSTVQLAFGTSLSAPHFGLSSPLEAGGSLLVFYKSAPGCHLGFPSGGTGPFNFC